MAKLPFTKLSLKNNNEVAVILHNEQSIEVKQYLPINTKLDMITNIINNSIDENNFYNPVRIALYTELGIIENYTNINFTDKQKEDIFKLYDLLKGNGIINKVIDVIPKDEYDYLINNINGSIQSIYNYKNSVMGILEAVFTDYSNLDLNASEIQKKLADPENMTLLKEVLTKLG
jgi:hypothetical protein